MAKKKANFRTRRAILEHLKRDGALTAKALAARLSVTEMAIRQHLTELAKERLVSFTEEQQGIGRPAKFWRLTPQADKFFPDAHAELTVGLLDALQQAFGPDGMAQLLKTRVVQQTIQYRETLPAEAVSLQTRLEKLAELRSREGYMAEIQKDGEGFLLIEHHCPICVAARACSGLCQAELAVFVNVIGNDADIRRVDHILAGAGRCAYRVTPHEKPSSDN